MKNVFWVIEGNLLQAFLVKTLDFPKDLHRQHCMYGRIGFVSVVQCIGRVSPQTYCSYLRAFTRVVRTFPEFVSQFETYLSNEYCWTMDAI